MNLPNKLVFVHSRLPAVVLAPEFGGTMRSGVSSRSRARVKRPPRVRIPRRFKPGAFERHQAMFDAHALTAMQRENAEIEAWEGITVIEPAPGDDAFMPDFRTGGIQRVGVWSVPADGPPPAAVSGARRFGSSNRVAVRKLPVETCHVYFKEKLFADWNRDRHMVLRKLGLSHENEDPEVFKVLMSTVRGDMDSARLEAQLTSVLKSSGVQDQSVLRHLVDSLKDGFVPDGDLRAFAATRFSPRE